MISKSTKKPRTFARLVNIAALLILGAILFVYGDSFSKSVLEKAAALRQTTAIDQDIGFSPAALEERVKSYKIDTDSALAAASKESDKVDVKEKAQEKTEDDIVNPPVVNEEETDDQEEGKSETSKTEPTDDFEIEEEEEEQDEDLVDEYTITAEDLKKSDKLVDAEYDDYEESSKESEDPKVKHADADYDYDEYEDEVKVPASPKKENERQSPLTDDDADPEEFLNVLEKCRDLICIQEAHEKYQRTSKMFNFPHFMIIGFQKAATTSLKKYLEKHPSIKKPRVKEPNFFPYDCHEKPPEKCNRANTTNYITKTLHLQDYIDSKGEIACFEASTHIVRAGHNLASRMAKLMPWLKIIVQFREPISRAASMMIHNKDVSGVGCLMKDQMGHCLLHHSQITEMPVRHYKPITYTEAIKPWIEAFPKDQIHVIQYESLTDEKNEAAELLRVKKFLGVDVSQPKGGLGLANSRRFRINPEGWPLMKSQYEELLDIVKPDVESLLELLYDNDLIDDPDDWRKHWQAHWDENLKTCENEKNRCNIMLS